MPHDWPTCVHEAGHVVGLLATGVAVTKVWVDGEDGRCHYSNPGNAVGLMAGCAAEWRIVYPGRTPSAHTLLHYQGSEDISGAAKHLGIVDGDLLVALWLSARWLIDSEWDSVLRVATELQRRGRLTGEQCAALWRGMSIAA